VADEYERVRPGYPRPLVARACEGLAAGATVVEIGCGTGKLTRELVALGLSVEAVEPDADLIAVARQTVPEGSVRFHNTTFEPAELPEEAFAAVFAATSFHWVDPTVGWRKVASLLEENGRFGLLAHASGLRGSLDEQLVEIWRRATGSVWRPLDDEALWTGAEERRDNISEVWSWLSHHHDLAVPEAAQLFGRAEIVREPFERDIPVDDYLARIRTTNNYLHMDAETQQRLERELAEALRAHGGVYPERTFAVLVTAPRAG
jgi:SAM-dependent methyltransferase